MSGKTADWLNTFKQHLLADKKKSTVLGALFLVLLVMIGRLFVPDAEPATLQAAPVVVTPVPSRDPVTPKTRPTPVESAWQTAGRRTNGPTHRTLPVHPHATPPRRSADRTVSVDHMRRLLERDPFNTTAWSKFLPAAGYGLYGHGAADGADGTGASGPLWQRLAAAAREHAETRRREAERLETELAELKLQSTMTGPIPMAYISGRLVHEQETIRGFLVVRIKDRRVTVRKADFVRELMMP